MKKQRTAKKYGLLLLTALMVLSINMVPANASETNDAPDWEVVEEFDVFYPDAGSDPENDLICVPRSNITYHVTQTGRTHVIGDYTGQSVSGVPGVIIQLSQMEETSFSASSNVALAVKSVAQAALGFNFSKSFTIGHSGSRQVPEYHNGRRVESAVIEAYRLYDKYDFTVTWTSIHVPTPQHYGSYWAKKPCGYHYVVIYHYVLIKKNISINNF